MGDGEEIHGQGSSAVGILWGGLIAGTMDITAAILTYKIRNNVPPVRILQSVASGLLARMPSQGEQARLRWACFCIL